MRRNLTNILLIVILFTGSYSCVSRRKSFSDKTELKRVNESAFDYLYVEALKQKLLGNSGEALRYLEQCIKIAPEKDGAYYQMAQILIGSGDIANARKYALKAYNIDSKNIWYVSMLSGIYYQTGNIDSAIVINEKAIVDFPNKQNIFLSLAGLYNEKGNFSGSIDIYRQLENKYGLNELTTPGYIESLVLDKKYDEALKKANQLIDAYPEVIQFYALVAEIYRIKGEPHKAGEVYNKLLKDNPENPQILLSAADFLLNEKKYDDLFVLINSIIPNRNISKDDKISLFAQLISVKFDNKDQADKLLLAIMQFESYTGNDDVSCLLRPEFLSNSGRVNEAISRLEEIIASRPNNYYAWEKLLLLYLQVQDFKKLLIKGEECATRFNMSFLAKLLYANAAIENSKYQIAEQELKKAEILAGENKEYKLQVLTMRADLYYRSKEYNKAFDTFEKALVINNEDLTILNNYAYYLAETGMDLKKAEDMARKVIEKEAKNDTFLDTYAWVLYKRGKLKDAKDIMEGIINRQSEPHAEYYEHLGFILRKSGNCDKAIEYWNLAIKSDSTKVDLIKEIENCKKSR